MDRPYRRAGGGDGAEYSDQCYPVVHHVRLSPEVWKFHVQGTYQRPPRGDRSRTLTQNSHSGCSSGCFVTSSPVQSTPTLLVPPDTKAKYMVVSDPRPHADRQEGRPGLVRHLGLDGADFRQGNLDPRPLQQSPQRIPFDFRLGNGNDRVVCCRSPTPPGGRASSRYTAGGTDRTLVQAATPMSKPAAANRPHHMVRKPPRVKKDSYGNIDLPPGGVSSSRAWWCCKLLPRPPEQPVPANPEWIRGDAHIDEEGAPQDVRPGEESPVATVVRLVPVVPHDPVHVLREQRSGPNHGWWDGSSPRRAPHSGAGATHGSAGDGILHRWPCRCRGAGCRARPSADRCETPCRAPSAACRPARR